MLDNPFSEVKFPNIQSKPPLAQLEAISSRPITCYLGEETDPTSLQPPSRQLLNNPSSLSCSSQALCSRPFTSFVALLWTRSSTSMQLGRANLDIALCAAARCPRPETRRQPGDVLLNLAFSLGQLPSLPGAFFCNATSDTSLWLFETQAMSLEGWRLQHFPGQPGPMLDNTFSEEIFPSIQSKPPLAQLGAISSCSMACYLGEETDPHLSTTSFQAVVESHKVSPQPPFLQAKQPQFPQPLLIRLVLQTLHQLRCPSRDTLQHLNVSLVGPKLNTVFEVRPHQCRVQGDNHFPTPAGHTISDTGQDAIGLLGHLGTLLAHIQVAIDQYAQVLLCRAAFQPLFPKPVALHGVAVTQVQDLALGLVEPHTIGLGPSIQPVQ
ncbi:LOW QUALITY PROTEIN: hypothetical protein QYF61_024005, partial [Mycteria americana]